MARPTNKLTALAVAKATSPGLLSDGGGLYLRVQPSGSKSWVLRYMLDGRAREMGLGPCPPVSLAQARQVCMRERAALKAQRIDPIDRRRATQETERAARRAARAEDRAKLTTFGKMAEAFIEANRVRWGNEKHAAQWKATLSQHAAAIWDTPVRDVDTAAVLGVLRPIWGTIPETASRLRGRIEKVLDAATVEAHRTGDNPARWRGHLAALLPPPGKRTRGNHAAMAYTAVPAFMQRLRAETGIAARALDFTILTAARSGEVMGAAWGEIDLDEKLWTIPAARMKSGREHRVPLTDDAVSILRDMLPLSLHAPDQTRPADDAPVFPGRKQGSTLSNMAFTMTLRRLGHSDVTAHGFRSSFRDWAGDRTTFQREVIEAALAHALGDKVEAAYRRSDALEKRRKLMQAWSDYLVKGDAATKAVPGGKVVRIGERRNA